MFSWLTSEVYATWYSDPQHFVIYRTNAPSRPYSLYEHGSIYVGSYKTLKAAKAKAERTAA